MVNTAIRAAREAGKIILSYLGRLDSHDISSKGQRDFVTRADQDAEAAIVDVVCSAYPEHGVIAEESGEKPGGEYTWVIDPLDGTTNFIHGYPHFCVSIAVLRNGQPEHGVIFDPHRGDLFCASRGGGAQLNDRRIRTTRHKRLNEALLVTGFPIRRSDLIDPWMRTFRALLPQAGGIRRTGSAALDLAYVAAGRFDGFWEFGLHPWDMAAGALLVREAGGLIADLDGGQNFLSTGNVVSANPYIFNELLHRINDRFNKS